METKYKAHDTVNHVSNYACRLIVIEVKQPNSAPTTYVCRWLDKTGAVQDYEFNEFELQLSEW